MKKTLRIGLCIALIACISMTLFACATTTGLAELNTEWRTDTYSRGKEPVRSSDMGSYPDYSSALSADITKSPYYMSLNGTWDFAFTRNHNSVPANFMKANFEYPDPSVKVQGSSKTEVVYWDKISVPSNWELSGYGNPSYSKSAYAWESSLKPVTVPETDNEIGLYRKYIEIPSDWNDRDIFISFDGVASGCYVYVNGALVGYGEDSYTTKSFRITDYVTPGQTALIAVKVYKYTYSSWIEAQDSVKLGGIFKDVYLTSASKTRIDDISIGVTFDEKYENASLKIDVSIATAYENANIYTLELAVIGQDNQACISNRKFGKDIKLSANKINGNYYMSYAGERVGVANPHKWSAEDPFLYTAIVTLKDSAGNIVDVASTNFGMVNSGFYVKEDGNQRFQVNGQPVTLKGILYYEFSAETGLAISEKEIEADILAMKALNINAIRSPGIPFSKTVLDLCDKYGLYVISDINLESEPYSDKNDASIPSSQSIWQSILIDRLLDVVDRDANRASVIMWAIGHQSGSGTSFRDLRNYLINNLDSRLIVYDDDDTYTDITVGTDWTFTDIKNAVGESSKKPILFEMSEVAYLNSLGELSTYMDIIESNEAVFGGFFGYWADKALYWPTDAENASKVLKETPYSVDPSLYALAYSGYWGEKISDGTKGLSGIVSADKRLQSESGEMKFEYSPIEISAVDVKSGKFLLKNHNFFTNFEDNYSIKYEVYQDAVKVSEDNVEGLKLNPGESIEFTVAYNTNVNKAENEYFVNFYVNEINERAWDKFSNGNVLTAQFDITQHEKYPNSNGTDTNNGEKLALNIIDKPEIYATALDLYLGKFYVSNNSNINFNKMFDCYFDLYEVNNFWAIPRSVLIATGPVNGFSVPANSEYVEQKFSYKMDQKAVEGGDYFFVIRMVLKTDIDEVFKAGYTLQWKLDEASLGTRIPFELDYTRSPHVLTDEKGTPILDENGLEQIVGGDPEPPADVPNAYIPDPDYTEYTPFIQLSNDDVSVVIDKSTGLITEYTYKGQSIIYTAGPQLSVHRTPTGGDQLSEVAETANMNILKAMAAGELASPIATKKISDNHYRVTVEYAVTDGDYKTQLIKSHTSTYTVSYDIFGDGEIVVSYSYDPSLYAGIPMQVANILVLNRDFNTVSWFGRGPSESYPDRVGNNLVGLYENVKVYDLTEDYLNYAGNGDRSDVRWLEIKNATTNMKILISSDSSNFAFNASKVAPGTMSAYTRNVLKELSLTYVSVIARQRGVSAGNIADSIYHTENSIIEPGANVSFSYRITPYTEGNAEDIAKTSLNVAAPNADAKAIVSGKDYAVSSITSPDLFISFTEDGIVLVKGLGTADQMWKKVTDETIIQAGLFQIFNVGHNNYLTATSRSASYKRYVEMGLGKYYAGNNWQSFKVVDNYNNIVGETFSLSLQPTTNGIGSRIVMKKMADSDIGVWEFVSTGRDDDTYFLRNKKTGYYLTPVDVLTYRNSKLAELADKYRNYPATDWNSLSSIGVKRPSADIIKQWIKTTNSVTLWNLLPDDTQRWTIKSASGGYAICNAANGEAFTIDNGVVTVSEYTGASNQIWTVSEVDGLFAFINEESGLALTQKITLVPMTQDEINENHITDMSKAFWKVNSIVAEKWTSAASQKWNLMSENDLKVSIEAGDNWFSESAD